MIFLSLFMNSSHNTWHTQTSMYWFDLKLTLHSRVHISQPYYGFQTAFGSQVHQDKSLQHHHFLGVKLLLGALFCLLTALVMASTSKLWMFLSHKLSTLALTIYTSTYAQNIYSILIIYYSTDKQSGEVVDKRPFSDANYRLIILFPSQTVLRPLIRNNVRVQAPFSQ